MDMTMTTPETITRKINPQELTESRLQLHYAVQYIAATGAALLEPLPDYSHTSMAWNPVLEAFVGIDYSSDPALSNSTRTSQPHIKLDRSSQ